MNKKSLVFLPAFFLSLFSCNTPYENVVGNRILAYTNPTLDSYVEIQTSEELDSIARFDDALVLVKSDTCQECEKTLGQLRDFIAESHYLIYAVDYDIYRINYDSIDNRSGPYAMLYPQIRNVPTFLYFRDGTLLDAHVGNYPSLEETLESKFLDLSLVVANDFIPSGRGSYYRDKAETIDSLGYGTSFLDSCLVKDEPLSVLFSWRRCQDCQEYKKDVLIPYLAESEPSPLLVYELDGYYLLKRDDDPENRETGLRLFSEFSKKYGLDGYPVEDSLGNIAGVAPTLVCYRGTERSLSVYRNDLGAVRNDDGTLSYSQSFYPEVLALKSKTTVEEGDTISDSYRKAMEELHDMAGPIEKEEASAFLKANL